MARIHSNHQQQLFIEGSFILITANIRNAALMYVILPQPFLSSKKMNLSTVYIYLILILAFKKLIRQHLAV